MTIPTHDVIGVSLCEFLQSNNTIAMNEESQKIADGVIEQLKQENAELKSMLKTVADDIEKHRKKAKENSCVMGCVEECLFYNDGKDECVYKHMTEIKKLISTNKNA